MRNNLNLSNCFNITDKGLENFKNMTSNLNLSFCGKITDEGF
jgi:hypothetical protein